jgi:hypothetical protein
VAVSLTASLSILCVLAKEVGIGVNAERTKVHPCLIKLMHSTFRISLWLIYNILTPKINKIYKSKNCHLLGRRRVALARTDVPPKLQFMQEAHGVISRKAAFFIVTAVKTSNLIYKCRRAINQ